MAKKLTHEEFILLCKEKYNDIDDYEFLTNYTKNTEKIKIKHKICNNEFYMISGNFKNLGYRCPYCAGNKKMNTELFKKRVFDLVQDEYIVIGEYKNAGTKIKLKHSKCNNVYEVTPSDFLNGSYRCPYCAGNKKLTFEMVSKKVEEIDSNYSIINSEENLKRFKNVHSPIEFFHKSCKRKFIKSFNNFRNGQRCTLCANERKESLAILEIKNFFIENKIYFIEEYIIDDLKNIRNLRIDFFLPDFKIFIEYDGKQHFEYSEKGFFVLEKYNYIKKNDNLKNEYFKAHNLNLLRINYKQDHLKILKNLFSSTTIENDNRNIISE